MTNSQGLWWLRHLAAPDAAYSTIKLKAWTSRRAATRARGDRLVPWRATCATKWSSATTGRRCCATRTIFNDRITNAARRDRPHREVLHVDVSYSSTSRLRGATGPSQHPIGAKNVMAKSHRRGCGWHHTIRACTTTAVAILAALRQVLGLQPKNRRRHEKFRARTVVIVPRPLLLRWHARRREEETTWRGHRHRRAARAEPAGTAHIGEVSAAMSSRAAASRI